MNEAVETMGSGRTRIGEWTSKGWDWFVEDPWPYLVAGLLATALFSFTGGILFGPVLLGLAAMGIRKERLERTEAADFFQGFNLFLPSFFSGLLIICFSLFGLIFLIVPGVVIFAMYLFTFHFIFDQGQDFWQAMESSRKLVARDYFGFTLFALLLVAINLLGAAFFGVGIVATFPIASLAITAAYLDCAGVEPPPVQDDARPVVIE